MTLPSLTTGQPLTGQLPKLGPAPPPQQIIWRFIKRYTISPAALDTTSIGDILLPANGIHAKIYWSAIDTTGNTVGSFGGLQVATLGNPIDTGGNYTWTDFSNANGGAMATAGGAAQPSWSAFVTTGGGTGSQWASNGRIYLQNYNDPTQRAKAWWDIVQVNAGTAFRRSGSGYHDAGQNQPVTRLHFFAGVGNLAAGTYFELWVAMPA